MPRVRGLVWMVALLFALVFAARAEAAPVLSLFKSGDNNASDNDRVYLIDRNCATPCVAPAALGGPAGGVGPFKGQLDVGDSLRAIFEMNSLNSVPANLGGTTPNNEWTGVIQMLITGKVAPIPGLTRFTLAPDPAFAADINGGIGPLTGIVPGVGAVVTMFEGSGVTRNYAGDFTDATAPVARGAVHDDGALGAFPAGGPPPSGDVSTGPYATEEAFAATAYDGVRFWTLGFTGPVVGGVVTPAPGTGEGAVYDASAFGDNILTAFGFTQGTAGGFANFGLNRLVNVVAETGDSVVLGKVITPFLGGVPGPPFGVADFAVTTTLKGVKDLDTAFEASSNSDVSFNVIGVPEAGMLLFLGAGALGLAGMGWRRSRSE